MTTPQKGYLIISDITGYTQFLSTSELVHAEEVLRTLLNNLIDHTKLPLVISRLEGDAVISYALENSILQGQTLVELMETTYVAFRKAIELMVLNTTCTCNACRNIEKLDLKFIVHFGTFVLQDFPSYTELIGPDVNLSHRLAKNQVTEKTGWKAYVLYTQAAMESMGLPEWSHKLPSHVETYEHLGDVQVFIQDMHAVWEAQRDRVSMAVQPEDAFLIFNDTFPLEPVQMWEYVTKPEYKAIFIGSESALVLNRNRGRIDAGSIYQCAHGKNITPQTIVDWQPFEQYTTMTVLPGGGKSFVTVHLAPVDSGTRISMLFAKIRGGNPFINFGIQLIFPLFQPHQVRLNQQLKTRIQEDLGSGGLFVPEMDELHLEEIKRSMQIALENS